MQVLVPFSYHSKITDLFCRSCCGGYFVGLLSSNIYADKYNFNNNAILRSTSIVAEPFRSLCDLTAPSSDDSTKSEVACH